MALFGLHGMDAHLLGVAVRSSASGAPQAQGLTALPTAKPTS
jgi:hypothetical protein